MSFKVSVEEARCIQARAQAEKMTVSAFLRKVALGMGTTRASITRGLHPVSGLPYNEGVGRIATEEVIRAVQIDFP